MATRILIIGEPRTGKSTAIKHLNPEETFILNVIDKPLPFKGHKSQYKTWYSDKPEEGNYKALVDYRLISKLVNNIDKNEKIKNLVIDDFQYLMANEYMEYALTKGFDKFTVMALNVYKLMVQLESCRQDLDCFVLSHSIVDDGIAHLKTLGKMLEKVVTLEGMFPVILHSLVIDGKYKFLTKHDGLHLAGSGEGTFDSIYIDNNLQLVKDAIYAYASDDIIQ